MPLIFEWNGINEEGCVHGPPDHKVFMPFSMDGERVTVQEVHVYKMRVMRIRFYGWLEDGTFTSIKVGEMPSTFPESGEVSPPQAGETSVDRAAKRAKVSA
jgi:hypothetical protein